LQLHPLVQDGRDVSRDGSVVREGLVLARDVGLLLARDVGLLLLAVDGEGVLVAEAPVVQFLHRLGAVPAHLRRGRGVVALDLRQAVREFL
jgi:hypothetical protein